jgi:hypothetical protein
MLLLSVGAQKMQETLSINAIFEGYDGDIYSFSDEDGNYYEFDRLTGKAKDKYDLTTTEFEGETFRVTYNIETKSDDFDGDREILVIVNLELLQ